MTQAPNKPGLTASTRPHFKASDYEDRIAALTEQYLDAHPDYIAFAIKNDPALRGISEGSARVQLESYPGVRALAVHEEAHRLYTEGKQLPAPQGEAKLNEARWLAEAAHVLTGSDIHPGTHIGEHFFMDHATGDVIGETARIGKRTVMYQGVTLGALGKTPATGPRHPYIGDDCVLSSGVQVLGHVHVGNQVNIGPGSLLRGNRLVVGDGVRIRDAVLIEDGFEIEAGLEFGNGATIKRSPHASNTDQSLVKITRESLQQAGVPLEEGNRVPAHSFIQLGAEGRLEYSPAGSGNKWQRLVAAEKPREMGVPS